MSLVKKIESYVDCPFRYLPFKSAASCTARAKYCLCNPEAGRSFPRRCPLKRGAVQVVRAGGPR
ncbi:MAG: hypothetical protein V2A79_09975 [Planctomycetota bacterium]